METPSHLVGTRLETGLCAERSFTGRESSEENLMYYRYVPSREKTAEDTTNPRSSERGYCERQL